MKFLNGLGHTKDNFQVWNIYIKERIKKLLIHLISVEDKFFTPHGFISLATHATSTLFWILGKSLLKPKRAHIHTKRL